MAVLGRGHRLAGLAQPATREALRAPRRRHGRDPAVGRRHLALLLRHPHAGDGDAPRRRQDGGADGRELVRPPVGRLRRQPARLQLGLVLLPLRRRHRADGLPVPRPPHRAAAAGARERHLRRRERQATRDHTASRRPTRTTRSRAAGHTWPLDWELHASAPKLTETRHARCCPTSSSATRSSRPSGRAPPRRRGPTQGPASSRSRIASRTTRLRAGACVGSRGAARRAAARQPVRPALDELRCGCRPGVPYPVPAHRLTPPGSPCSRAAARIGAVT